MNNHTQWQLFVGLSDSKGRALTKKTVDVAIGSVIDALTEVFGGATLESSVGAWGAIREDSLIITVITSVPNDTALAELTAVAHYLKDTLRQESIFITKCPIECVSI